MKRFTIIVLSALLIAALLSSCQSYREYSIGYDYEIPDSSNADYIKFVESIVEKSNPAHLATNKSRDFGQIIEAAGSQGWRLYSVTVEELRIKTVKRGNYISTHNVSVSDLTPELTIWFDLCKSTHTPVRESFKY